jgi:hypothetical protein
MISSSRAGLLLKLCAVLLILATACYFFFTYDPHNYHRVIGHKIGQKASFIEIALDTEIDDPIDLTDLQALCVKSKWKEGLIISCGTPYGGISPIRNIVLNCVRYAIEAGGAIFPKDGCSGTHTS